MEKVTKRQITGNCHRSLSSGSIPRSDMSRPSDPASYSTARTSVHCIIQEASQALFLMAQLEAIQIPISRRMEKQVVYNHTKKYYISVRKGSCKHAIQLKLRKTMEGNFVEHKWVHTVQLHYIKFNKRGKVIYGVCIHEGSYHQCREARGRMKMRTLLGTGMLCSDEMLVLRQTNLASI